MYKIINLFLGCCFFLTLSPCVVKAEIAPLSNMLYFGLTAGYGATTWEGLVPAEENQNSALAISAPIRVHEGGFMWGFFSGYEFSPYFAVESYYRRYPTANIKFDKDSLFSFDHRKTSFSSHTKTIGIIGKIMLIIPNTTIRVYSGAGPAVISRQDQVNTEWRVTPSFDIGFNVELSRHFMLGLNGNYTAGYGESEIDPAKDYFPFLYSVFMSLTYRL
ncbi:outer membrane beta-barrel protein [Legionella sp. D16C41]|uniref:outer membrane beta-barrel protein n=1 Tax=Legionella sp. D16C41 TaxID=3402688 RepID=UPI003AF8D11C